MPQSKRMIKHRLGGLSKSYGNRIDPEKSEELKRTKSGADIDNNLTRILKLIKNEDQSKKDGNFRKDIELVGLIEDFYNQYQSLYALHGRLTGEYVKVVPRRADSVPSVSSSSSESEYFSSEEVDANTEVNANTHHVLKTFAPTEAKEFEEQLNTQTKKLKSLNQQKRNLELQVESQAHQVKSQAHQVKQLSANNTELQARVLELELLLKESKGAVSILHAKLKNNEYQATSKIAELMARINRLEQEAKSLRTQKGKMEEKIRRNRNEALSQKNDFTDQLNVMQQDLDSVCNKNKELEALLRSEREKVRIENLQESLAETSSVEQNLLKERECFLSSLKDLELEVESRCSKQNDLEEQLRDTSSEFNRLADEGKALQDRNHELERAMTEREEELCALLREHEKCKNEASEHAMTLTAEVEHLRKELDTLKEQKSKLELLNERRHKENSESLAKMENYKVKLETQVADQEKTIKKLSETIDQTREENKQAKVWSKKFKLNQQSAEKKMEELAGMFRKEMEDNIRMLHQRIHVAEQLDNENKVSYKMAKQRYEQENKMLGEKIASYEDQVRTLEQLKGTPLQIEVYLNELDLVAEKKVEEHREYVIGLVSKMLGEVQFAKDWVKKRNGEMKELKDKVDSLTALVGEKEEQELLLREKVWKIEAILSKEGGEKLNLIKEVSKLERKVRKLEKNLKEKDEELVGLAEKKREAIRQLCFLIEFHRGRCIYLEGFISKTRLSNTK
ncbi:COP1-interactive protein 1-like [Gastrolobium bilobum]|uniref:COP1-interactive protein 1-like n=1 Tax=Gastrolobium bilobum TaxID=150636 RepID=UPI002AAFE100|nr:COP1-interactive protein 1-like [Gastrolobium bilobum]